jgi:thiamine-monophosphate kinase
MTEKEWLEYLKKYLWLKPPVISAFNEDCAVIQSDEGKYLLLTTDALIEGVHFDLKYTDLYSLGVKLAVSNLSDIASMGGEPRWALLTLGSPKAPESSWIDPLMEGLVSTLERYGAYLIGGDTVKSPCLMLNLALTGETDKPLLRSGARPGDFIFVSRALGESAAFLRYIKNYALEEIPENLKKAHLRPTPEIELGRTLKFIASACMDISDGLLLDLSRICLTSGVSAEIEEDKIPVGPWATLEEALSGGEDYALLFTLPAEKLEELEKNVSQRVFRIGKIIEGEGKIFIRSKGGELKEISPSGFDHFTFQSQP